jgi:hypothetical protein
MSDLAEQLIAENARTKEPHLDLGQCGLTELPPALLKLTHLTSLNLGEEYAERMYATIKNAMVRNQFTGKALTW